MLQPYRDGLSIFDSLPFVWTGDFSFLAFIESWQDFAIWEDDAFQPTPDLQAGLWISEDHDGGIFINKSGSDNPTEVKNQVIWRGSCPFDSGERRDCQTVFQNLLGTVVSNDAFALSEGYLYFANPETGLAVYEFN